MSTHRSGVGGPAGMGDTAMFGHTQGNGKAGGAQGAEEASFPWWCFIGHERDIALLRAQGNGVEAIADRLGMNAATVTITLFDLERRLAKVDIR